MRLSTGTINKMMDTGSLKSLLDLCFIDIYSGVQPTLPDNVPNGAKLCTIYSDGAVLGLTWGPSAAAGVLSKTVTETWSCTSAPQGGTAGWFRIREASDTGLLASTTAVRLDGSIATSGGDMNLGSLTVSAGAPFVVPAASLTLPQQ